MKFFAAAASVTSMAQIGSLHYVRPDRIVRTGVLSPIVGYQPQTSVIAVTQEFASGPSTGMQLSGLGFPPIGQGPVAVWFKTLGARIKATLNAARANQIMLTDNNSVSAVVAQVGVDPRTQVMAPASNAMSQMAHFLSYRDAPERGGLFARRRWNTYYYAG